MKKKAHSVPARAKIAAPLKAAELKDEEQDKELNQEIVKSPSPPKGKFQGRWNAGFGTRSNAPGLIRGNYKAQAEGLFRTADASKAEIFRSSGHVKAAGKHISADGLVSRRGYRRILPSDDGGDAEAGRFLVEEVAKEVLRGREATIFEKRLAGVKLEALAEQFGRSISFIHAVIEKSKVRVMQAIKDKLRPAAAGERCPTCGLFYGQNTSAVCPRGYGDVNFAWWNPWSTTTQADIANIHPECARRYEQRRK
jgi:hypothetical protein